MRELTFVRPRVLEWREVPEPELLSGSDAVVSPVAATTCDLDRSIIKGRAPYAGPIALGHEFVARIEEIGDEVRRFLPGDIVVVPAQISCGQCGSCQAGATSNCESVRPQAMFGMGPVAGDWGGGFSDLVRIPFADHMLVRVPEGVPGHAVAAASDNLTVAWQTVIPHLRRMPGAGVLVAGVGSTGLYAVQMAQAGGAGRIGYLDHNPARLQLAGQFGAEPIDIQEFEAVDGNVRLSLPEPYEIVVDARGDEDALGPILKCVAPGGVCTIVSMYFRPTRLPLLEMFLRGVRLELTRCDIRAHLEDALTLVQSGRLRPDHVTTEVLPWDRLTDALVDSSMKPVFIRETMP